jgi:release factor glutamine methyltransferase
VAGEASHPSQILDLFSGSGCIGLSLLKNCQNIEVDFGEIKKENISQIKKNIQINNLENKNFQIFQSDIFKNIPQKKYNFILSNPPYISKNRKFSVQKSVLENEDPLALFAKDDGLYFIKKIILDGQNFLKKKGQI